MDKIIYVNLIQIKKERNVSIYKIQSFLYLVPALNSNFCSLLSQQYFLHKANPRVIIGHRGGIKLIRAVRSYTRKRFHVDENLTCLVKAAPSTLTTNWQHILLAARTSPSSLPLSSTHTRARKLK